jgi:hypothetical protein
MTVHETTQTLDLCFKHRVKKPSECIVFKNGTILYLYDDAIENTVFVEKADISDEIAGKMFVIRNDIGKEVALWRVDGCFISEGKEKCDAVFFNENKFCFIEFKRNSFGKKKESIIENRQKGAQQLLKTIQFLYDNKPVWDFINQNHVIEAFLSTPPHYAEHQFSATELAYFKDFIMRKSPYPIYTDTQKEIEAFGVRFYEKNETLF